MKNNETGITQEPVTFSDFFTDLNKMADLEERFTQPEVEENKGCEHCKDEQKIIHLCNEDGFKIEVFIENDKTLCVNMYSSPYYFENEMQPCFNININYCPMCGRKLGE